jgi:VanZ family protein
MRIERRQAYIRWAFALCLLVGLVVALLPPQTLVPPTGWDKANHAIAFAVFAVLGCVSYPARTAGVLLGLLAYGALIELLQGLTTYRSAEALDVLADGVGLALGWTLMRLSSRIRGTSKLPAGRP